jgi:hypothetical protein
VDGETGLWQNAVGKLGFGGVVGVVVGAGVLVLLAPTVAVVLILRRKRRKKVEPGMDSVGPSPGDEEGDKANQDPEASTDLPNEDDASVSSPSAPQGC